MAEAPLPDGDKEERQSYTSIRIDAESNIRDPFIVNTSATTLLHVSAPDTFFVSENFPFDDRSHYSVTNHGQDHQFLLPNFASRSTPSATEHDVDLCSMIPFYGLASIHNNLQSSSEGQNSYDLTLLSDIHHTDLESKENPTCLADLLNIHPTTCHYSNTIHDEQNGIVHTFGPTDTSVINKNTFDPWGGDTETCCYDSIQAHSGSHINFDNEYDLTSVRPTADMVEERVVERFQLDAWLREMSEKGVTLSEKLEKVRWV